MPDKPFKPKRSRSRNGKPRPPIKFRTAMGDGKPLARQPGTKALYATVDGFAKKAKAYFDSCLVLDTPPTTSGLALHLGYANVSGVTNIGGRGPEWKAALAWVRTMIRSWHENKVLSSDDIKPSLAWLKKNAADEWSEADAVSDGPKLVIHADFSGVASGGDVAAPRDGVTVIEGEVVETIEDKAEDIAPSAEPAPSQPAKTPPVRKRKRPV